MKKIISFILFISFFQVESYSQIDSLKMEFQSYDSQLIERLKSDKSFDYNYSNNESSWFQYVSNMLSDLYNWFLSLFNLTNSESSFLINLLLILAILAVTFLVYKLTNSQYFSFFNKKNLSSSARISKEEDLDSINFDEEIEAARKSNDYRTAIRLLYLKSLKFLSDKNLIQIKIYKTNFDYINDLNGSSIQSEFKRLSISFNQIWYGQFEADKEEFQKNETLFESINAKIEEN